MPGGVNSPVRAMKAIGRDPIFVASGAGAMLTDVDELRTLASLDEDRLSADGPHRANG